MNTPPETFIRVQSTLLEAFVKDCFVAVGMSDEARAADGRVADRRTTCAASSATARARRLPTSVTSKGRTSTLRPTCRWCARPR